MFRRPAVTPRNCVGCDTWTVFGTEAHTPTALHRIALAVQRSIPHMVATNPGVDWANLGIGQTIWTGDADVWLPNDRLVEFCVRHRVDTNAVRAANPDLHLSSPGNTFENIEPWTVVRIPRSAASR